MNDVPFSPGESRELPGGVGFDPGVDPLPPEVGPGPDYPGAGLLLLAAGEDPAWEADAAVAIATAWARAGRRIVLADLQVDDPRLHERLDLSNDDGVVDIFLYGASLARNARPVAGRDFFFLAAGTYASDPERIYTHPRWQKLVAGFRDAEASILLFVRAGSGDLSRLTDWARTAVVLGRVPAVDVPGGVRIRAVLIPVDEGGSAAILPPAPGAYSAADPVEASTVEYGYSRTEAALPDFGFEEVIEPEPEIRAPRAPEADAVEDPVSRGGESRPGTVEVSPPPPPPSPPQPSFSDDPLVVPPDLRPEGRRRSGRAGNARLARLILGTVVFVAAVAVLVYVLVQEYPELFGAGSGDTVALTDPPAPVLPAEPAGNPLPYAVFAKSFNALEAAREHAATESRSRGDIPYYVVPERRQGVLHYLVMAGFPADTLQALRIRQHLVEVGSVDPEDAAGEWALIQHRPLAFFLNDQPNRSAASEAVANLWETGVPAYAVPIPYSDGTERWRLYSGAYADSARAEDMREILMQNGLPARLVQRLGRTSNPDG
jgi:hypothetical protein